MVHRTETQHCVNYYRSGQSRTAAIAASSRLNYSLYRTIKLAITFQPVAYAAPTAPAGVTREEFAAQNEAVQNAAIVNARTSNSQLVTTQAIQSLIQVLSSLPAVR